MSMFAAFNISASGMTAQQLRTDVISQNIANANTTRTSDGTAYVKKSVVFTEKTVTSGMAGRSVYSSSGTTFADALRAANGGVVGSGVKVTSIYDDTSTDMIWYMTHLIRMQMRMDMLHILMLMLFRR